MAETVKITIDGIEREVPSGTSVAAAVLNAGVTAFRTSVVGSPRVPLCGMGICFECRLKIDGSANPRSCLETVREGMEVVTGD